jgi:hypothetical protein
MFSHSNCRAAAIAVLSSWMLAACWGSGKGNSGSTGSTGGSPPPAAGSFTVGGTVAGLAATESVVLRNNGSGDLTVNGSGPFTFAAQLANGATYAVTVATQPAGRVCSVTGGNGVVSNANVTSVQVACVAQLVVTTASLQNGVQGVNYAQPIGATGGLAPYGFRLANGQLPPGLLLSGAGLTGVPGVGGTYDFNVRASDAANPPQTALRNYRVLILEITSKALANGIEGEPYNQPFGITGEVGVVTWSLSPNSAPWPPGLTIPPGSALVHGPPTQGGVYTVELQATDSDAPARTHVQRLTIRILAVATRLLPNGIEKQAYSQVLTVTGELGAVTWAMAQGTLPAGLTLNANGTISGTPTQTGTSTFTVQVTDSDAPARSHRREISITIDAAAAVGSFDVVNVLEDGTPEANIYLNNRLLPSARQYSINRDGRYVAFTTASGKVLLRDTCKGSAPADCVPSTSAVSNVPNRSTNIAFSPAISASGRWIAYRSTSATEDAANLPPGVGTAQYYVLDTCIGATGTCFPRRLLIPERTDNNPSQPRGVAFPGAIGPEISADGRYVLFSVNSDKGLSPDLTVTGQPAILVHDRDPDGDGVFDEPGETRNQVVSYRPGGNTLFGDDPSVNDFPTDAALSGDGNMVAMVSGLPGQSSFIFRHSRALGFTFNLLDLIPPNPLMESLIRPDLSFDGSQVAFTSASGGGGVQLEHVFRGSRVGPDSDTTLVTSAILGGVTMGFQPPSLSSTGRFLAFDHFSDELGAGNRMGTYDVFIWDCPPGPEPCAPALRCLTGTLPNGAPTTIGSGSPRISGDGAYVVFISGDALDPSVPTAPGFQRLYISPTGVRE